ncbi:MAG: chemotaxis protein CheW [Labilithrix sp.]|nr:chemotaxis protein CheW [Labilithrix sp.]
MGGPQLFLFRARRRTCALPIACVVETMRPLPVEPLAGTPRPVLGLSVIRGGPLAVVDFGALIGDHEDLEGHEDPVSNRFLVVRTGTRKVALAVDAVIGIRTMPPETLAALPPLLRSARAEIEGVAALDDQIVLLVDSARIVSEAAWAAIERGAAR